MTVIVLGDRPTLGRRHARPDDLRGTSKRTDAPRLNPNLVGQIREADRDETLPQRMGQLLGIPFTGYHAEGDGDGDGDGEGAFRGYVAEVDGCRVGINRDIYDDLHPWEYNLHRHIEKIVLGHANVDRPDGFDDIQPHLSDLQEGLLRYDGFSPLGVTLAAWALGRVTLDAGERRHVIKAWNRHSTKDRLSRPDWEQMQIDLGQGVVVGKKGILIRTKLPETVISTLPGRRASEAIGHPVLTNYVITSISTRKKGHTIVVEKQA